MAVVLNTTIPSSALKKKHQAYNYHKVRESIAGGFIKYGNIQSDDNMADILTKPLSRIKFERLTSQYIFRRPKNVTANQTVQANMVYQLPEPRAEQEKDLEEYDDGDTTGYSQDTTYIHITWNKYTYKHQEKERKEV